MPKAAFKGVTLAESDQVEVVEDNLYFPPESVNREYFKPSPTHTTCPWKGEAHYYSLQVNGETVEDAAWYYPEPKDAAKNIRDCVAFYEDKVQVERQ